MALNGMVASAHALASVPGLGILADGGNAIDAAVMVGSTLDLVESHISRIGGIGVALAHVASEGETRVFDFSGSAPIGTFTVRRE